MKSPNLWPVLGRAFAVALLGLGATASHAASRKEQEHACRHDALHFCKADVPDEAKITECMKQHYAQLSPACQAMFGKPQPDSRSNG